MNFFKSLKIKKIKLLKIFIFFLIFCFLKNQTFAQDKGTQQDKTLSHFDISLSREYKINQDQLTTVKNTISIENKTPVYYMDTYKFSTSLTDLEDIKVIYQKKQINPQIEKTQNNTTITFKLPKQITGIGKKQSFTITFKTKSIAKIYGNVLELTIQPSQIKTTSLSVIVPKKFKSPFSNTKFTIKPYKDENYQLLQLTPINEPITITFGQEQYYKAIVFYDIRNFSSSETDIEIPIIPDTFFQKVVYTNIDPKPNHIRVDKNGNWIVSFKLKPNEKKIVKTELFIKTSLAKQQDFKSLINPSDFLTPVSSYWPSNDEKIKNLASIYNTPNKIYKFTIDTLSYNADIKDIQNSDTKNEFKLDVKRSTPIKILEVPASAICEDYVDLFITLARANNIPALMAIGYTSNNDTQDQLLNILHSWVYFFDNHENQWKRTDPTWGDSSNKDYFNNFDLNHIVFVFRGLDPTKPLPPGSYVYDDSDIDVPFEIQTIDTFNLPDINISLTLEPEKIFKILDAKGIYILNIKNNTGMAIYDLDLQTSHNIKILKQSHINVLLPFQTIKKQIYVNPKINKFISQKTDINIKLVKNNTTLVELNTQGFCTNIFIQTIKRIASKKIYIIISSLIIIFFIIFLTFIYIKLTKKHKKHKRKR